jgi:hypothetical protein
MDQILNHLQPDKSATYDDGGAGVAIGYPGTDTAGVRDVANRENTG